MSNIEVKVSLKDTDVFNKLVNLVKEIFDTTNDEKIKESIETCLSEINKS
jgi:hypothetical protein